MNPLVKVMSITTGGRALWIWCPGCNSAHSPQVLGEDGSRPDGPVWEWNGQVDERFTISPSLLCHHSVHLCPPDYVHHEVCPNPDECDRNGHLVLGDERGHNLPHIVDPAWGPCHSFIRDGQWQFLGDCAHALAGQTVPMVPLPDWLAG